MPGTLRTAAALSIIAVVALVSTTSAAKVEIRSERDKKFDFSQVRTWAWDQEPGKVLMAVSAQDDPAAIQRRFGQTIVDAIASEFTQRGLNAASTPPGDVRIYFYLLVTVGIDAQQFGQFLPPVTDWSLPPFAPQTTSYDIVQRGALVIDAVSTSLDRVVWRAVGRSEIDTERTDDARKERLRTVVRELVKKFPKK
jgi:hypothetical protein